MDKPYMQVYLLEGEKRIRSSRRVHHFDTVGGVRMPIPETFGTEYVVWEIGSLIPLVVDAL